MASSNSIKVVGTLYPNSKLWPVVESSDIKGGLHTVEVYDDLAKISRYRREEGMLCYVILLKEYYQFKGNKWVLFETGGSSSVSKGLLIVTPDELDPSSEYYNPDLYDKSKISDGDLIFVQTELGKGVFKLAFYFTDDEGNVKIDYNDGECAGSPYGLNNIVTQNQIIDKIDKSLITDESGEYDEELVEEYSKTVPNMKAVIDYVDEHGSIMCADALNYYEVQYHKMFNFTWTPVVNITSSVTSINPQNEDSKEITLTATFKASGSIKYPDPDSGEIIVNDKIAINIIEVTGVDSSWTVSDTNPLVYTKTVTISKDGDTGLNYKSNPSFSIIGDVTVKEWSAEQLKEIETTDVKNTSGKVTITITKGNWYNYQLSAEPESWLTYINDNYKAFGSTVGEKLIASSGTSIEGGDNKYIYFITTSSKFVAKQPTGTILSDSYGHKTITDTIIGTYYIYKSEEPASQAFSDVTISF